MNRHVRLSNFPQVRSRLCKRGLTFIQLVGCVAAITVGIVVGALFLDVDLKAAWQLGLENVGVATPHEKPAHSDAVEGAESDSSGNPQDGSSGKGRKLDGKAAATLAYWNGLREIIQTEQANRDHSELQAGGDIRGVMYARIDAFGQAAEAIDALAIDGVDAEAVQLGRELAKWYEQAVEICEQGTLLDEADLSSDSGPQGRRWHSAQKQQSERLDLLTRKTTSLQGKLSARYRTQFPDLR